jgi:hypothetical protein
MSNHGVDNRSDQLNPNNDAFWSSRGWDDRPDDWEEKAKQNDVQKESSQKSNSQHEK